MDLYVPDRVDALPAIVVALHYCTGSANRVHNWFQTLADIHGFIIIAADAANNCWDASPGRANEKAAIAKMVEYTLGEYKADKTRVFVVGSSSGACMTNTMMASYPELFAGGSVLAGVPVGSWPAGNTSCSNVCGVNPPSKTAGEWGDLARQAYPGYNGPRPRVQLFHGTKDEYLYFPYLTAEVAQWSNVLGLSEGNVTKENNKPSSGWDRVSYKNASGVVMLEVNTKQNEVHDLGTKGLFPDVIRFFGLDKEKPNNQGGSDGGIDGRSSGAGGSPGTGGNTAYSDGSAGNIVGNQDASREVTSTGGSTSDSGISGSGGMLTNSGGTQANGGTINGGTRAPINNGGSLAVAGNSVHTNQGGNNQNHGISGGSKRGCSFSTFAPSHRNRSVWVLIGFALLAFVNRRGSLRRLPTIFRRNTGRIEVGLYHGFGEGKGGFRKTFRN